MHAGHTLFLLLSSGPVLASAAGLLPTWPALARRAELCNVTGYADTDNNYFQSASRALTSYAGCSARCAGQRRCKSFGASRGGVCLLFDEPLAGNFRASRRASVAYSDVGCVRPPPAPSATPARPTAPTRTAASTTTRPTLALAPSPPPPQPTDTLPTGTAAAVAASVTPTSSAADATDGAGDPGPTAAPTTTTTGSLASNNGTAGVLASNGTTTAAASVVNTTTTTTSAVAGPGRRVRRGLPAVVLAGRG